MKVSVLALLCACSKLEEPPPHPAGEIRDRLLERGNKELMQPAPLVRPGRPRHDPAARLEAIDEHTLRLGALRIDVARGVVEAPGTIATVSGPLEYVAVSPFGKSYESITVLDALASHLELALTLAGAVAGALPPPGASAAGSPAHGEPVRLHLRLGDREIGVHELMRSRQASRQAPPEIPWLFTGSALHEGRISGDETGSLVGMRHDASAPVNASVDLGNPYAAPDTGFEADPQRIPPVGTPVVLVFAVTR